MPASERSEHRWFLGGKANRFAGRGQYMSEANTAALKDLRIPEL